MNVVEALVGGRLHVRVEGSEQPGARVLCAALAGLPQPVASSASPDLVFRFAGRVRPTHPPQRPLPAGIGADGLWVADHLGRALRLQLGSPEPLVVADQAIDPGFLYVWGYLPMVRSGLWRQGLVLVHASGAVVGGQAVAIAGWQGAGKTMIGLELLASGAAFLADDWLAVAPSGVVSPVSGLLNLDGVHRDSMGFRRWQNPRVRFAGTGATMARALSRELHRAPATSVGLSKLGDVLRKASKVKTSISCVFPQAAIAPSARLATLMLLVPEGGTPPDGAGEAATFLSSCSVMEWRDCLGLEALLAFAAPGNARRVFPTGNEEAAVLSQALAGVHVRTVRAPSSPAEVDAVASLLATPGHGASTTLRSPYPDAQGADRGVEVVA
ncbi:MAG: hypothetical protein ACYCV7_14770 [Acidimicrobiales bacterium]